MTDVNLTELTAELLDEARAAKSGRAAQTVRGHTEHRLRHTVIALTGGSELADHESPGEATLQVLSGSVRITAPDGEWSGAAGALVDIPPVRHGLIADEDSAVLLTVALSE
ncbi:hypothetical protein [Gordonia phthalatica]|uniref:Cupin n=1 Tax=Gordonia phthalatica TaxID=1136941 RepID=A0A0N7FUY3_9ACTN|nr:hypothetical protein [Gordonia phthalatica]ALG85639.1 cupin [Gordonia phthalatica]